MTDRKKRARREEARHHGSPPPDETRRFERRLPHRPEKVWRALTETSELDRWFPARIEGEREEGSTLRFSFRERDEADTRGTITRWDPPRVFTYTMGQEVVRWELFPTPDGTLLVLTTEVRSAPANDDTTCRMAA